MNIELCGRIGLTTRDACSFLLASASAAAAAAFFFASSSALAFAAAADSSRAGNLSNDAIHDKKVFSFSIESIYPTWKINWTHIIIKTRNIV